MKEKPFTMYINPSKMIFTNMKTKHRRCIYKVDNIHKSNKDGIAYICKWNIKIINAVYFNVYADDSCGIDSMR